MKGNFNFFLKKKKVSDLFNDLFDANHVDEDITEISYNRSAREAYNRLLEFFDDNEYSKKPKERRMK